MFPFFEPNLFPLLEGAAHFLYLLAKRRAWATAHTQYMEIVALFTHSRTLVL